jgi:hypothetical protein
LWVWLSRIWRSALAIVKPETVISWHRAGFRLFWTWKVWRGLPGRPVSGELLFRQPANQNVMLHSIENLPPYQFARDRL